MAAIAKENDKRDSTQENDERDCTQENDKRDCTQENDKRWADSVLTMVRSVDSPYGGYVQPCSISIVPEGLEELNEDAYVPKVVSMGPRYRGTKEHLVLMEKIKLHCMSSLLHRSKGTTAPLCLEECTKAILELDEVVRASYVVDIKLTRYELAQVMLVDGCFLLELLISKNSKLNKDLKSRLEPAGPGPEVIKHEEVLSDLILLENQIPVLVLHELSRILFPSEFTKKDSVAVINGLALSLLGLQEFPSPDDNSPHLLELVHSSIVKGKEVIIQPEETKPYMSLVVKNPGEVKLKRCATRLQAAGVTIKLPSRYTNPASLKGNSFGRMLGNMFGAKQVDMPAVLEFKNLDFDIKFNEGTLEIPQLHITKTTKARWRNVIAWEHYKKDWRNSSMTRRQIEASYHGSTALTFSYSALFFNGLICCAADVQLLKDNNIIVDHLKMKDQDLKDFFFAISKGIDHEMWDAKGTQLFDDLNNYSAAYRVIRSCKIWWHNFIPYFAKQIEKLIKFMKTDYNFVAVVLSALAIPQTIYAIVSYYQHK
ncbi:UPF0481 protein At3g47200-like [Gastrolobium bilobum]|uniref:UPF0481 protein At3g47200-like n=1 Tax=Gastrolobium bilobum TaxID=150636 RepID=UPI002AB1530D|nr:UPF0481 protein At3g47200-like [Gastrolobium bilobum]